MKNIALLYTLFMLSFLPSKAQNYRCFQPGSVQYFLNGKDYLRGMRIDSVRVSGSDTIYYPYHTPRGYYMCTYPGLLDSTGGSWLGKRVVEQPNGDFLFDNFWNDTVLIKTQANTGDSWTFFRDTTSFSYVATVVAEDTMTILGVLDSVKTISIQSDSVGATYPADPVNGLSFKLSKNHGFVQIFDLYTFPYHRPDSMWINRIFFDYYMDLTFGDTMTSDVTCYPGYVALPDTNNTIFKQIQFSLPTTAQMYNIDSGDVFEYVTYYNNGGDGYAVQATIDTYLTRSVSGSYANWRVKERIYNYSLTVSGYGLTYDSSETYALTYMSQLFDSTPFFQFSQLPEEWLSNIYINYLPDLVLDSSGSCHFPVYKIFPNNIDYSTTSVVYCNDTYDGFSFASGNYQSYAPGYGQIGNYYINCTSQNTITTTLNFAKKGACTYGTFSPIYPLSTVQLSHISNEIKVYPNPANKDLFIDCSQPINDLRICNIMGQELIHIEHYTSKTNIDLSNLPNGVYLVRLDGVETLKFVKMDSN